METRPRRLTECQDDFGRRAPVAASFQGHVCELMNDADEDQVEEELEPVWRALLALAPQFASLDVLPDDWGLKDVCEVDDLCVIV